MRWNLYFQSTCHFKTASAGKRLIIDPLRLHPPVSSSIIRPSIIQHPNAASAGSFAAIRSTHLQPPPFHAFVRSSRSFIARTNHSIHIHTSNRGQDSKRHSDQAARRRSLASSLSLSLSLFHLRSRIPFANGDPAFRLMFDDLYNVSIDRHTARISLLPLLPISLSLTLLLAYLRRNAVRDFIDFISYGEIRFALSYVACFIPRCIQAKFTLFLPLSPSFSSPFPLRYRRVSFISFFVSHWALRRIVYSKISIAWIILPFRRDYLASSSSSLSTSPSSGLEPLCRPLIGLTRDSIATIATRDFAEYASPGCRPTTDSPWK